MGRILSVLLLLVLAVAEAQPPRVAPREGPFQSRLVGVPRVTAAAPLPVRLQLKNLASVPAFAPVGVPPQFDVVITNAQGAVVRRRAVPVPLPGDVVTDVVIAPRGPTLGPGEVLTVAWTWDLRDDRGQPVQPGRYCLTGRFQNTGTPSVAGLITVPWCVWVLRSGA